MGARAKKKKKSPLAHGRGVLSHLLRDIALFPALTLNILFRPPWTGATVIRNDPEALFHALKYYSEMFTLAFMISVVANQFQLFEGESEWRGLIGITVQLLIGIPILYVLCLALPERIPFLTLTQAVLYVDGAFILILAIVSIPISYLDLTLNIPTANRELDIFATEYERCLSHHSTFYWLMRGDLQFFLYIDRWKPQDWANWLFDNFNYPLFAPFLLIIALTLRPKRKTSVALICLFAAIAYLTAVEGSNFIKSRLGTLIAGKHTECVLGHLDQVISKYAPSLIARQIAYKINNEALKAHQYFVVTSVDGTAIVATVKLNPNVEPTWQVLMAIPPSIKQSYCSNYIFWVAARRINYNLLVIINDKDNTLVHRQQFAPKDCPAWG